jgi:hypothetical protein
MARIELLQRLLKLGQQLVGPESSPDLEDHSGLHLLQCAHLFAKSIHKKE